MRILPRVAKELPKWFSTYFRSDIANEFDSAPCCFLATAIRRLPAKSIPVTDPGSKRQTRIAPNSLQFKHSRFGKGQF